MIGGAKRTISTMKKLALADGHLRPIIRANVDGREAWISRTSAQVFVYFDTDPDTGRALRVASSESTNFVSKFLGDASVIGEVDAKRLQDTLGKPDWRKRRGYDAKRWHGVLFDAGLLARVAYPLSGPVIVMLGTKGSVAYLVFESRDAIAITMGLRDDREVVPEIGLR